MHLRSGRRPDTLESEIAVVGVLNVTPDSYVDGGRYSSPEQVRDRAGQILAGGGSIIEIGGESTGPGSPDVSVENERSRVIPAVQTVRKAFPGAWICIDTWKAAVASDALEAGADMINDITAGRGDAGMFDVISRLRCPYVMMYAKDPTARTTREDREYDDVVSHISRFLAGQIDAAVLRDIDRDRIIVDPGLGHFVSAKPQYSFEILRRLKEFTAIAPVMISPSRKSFLAGPENLPPSGRLPGTLAATAVAIMNGASFIRTHDVGETRQVCDAAMQMR